MLLLLLPNAVENETLQQKTRVHFSHCELFIYMFFYHDAECLQGSYWAKIEVITFSYGRHHNLVNSYGISVSQSRSSCLVYYLLPNITGMLTRVTWRVSLVEQELFYPPRHISLPTAFSGARVVQHISLPTAFNGVRVVQHISLPTAFSGVRVIQHISLPTTFSGVRVAQSSIFRIVLYRQLIIFFSPFP